MSKEEVGAAHRHRRYAETYLQQDKAQLNSLEKSQADFLSNAMNYSAKAVIASDLFDNTLIRFTSLWFENFANGELNELIASIVQQIPSHKFVFLTHQISARLSNTPSSRASNGVTSHETAIRKSHKTVYTLFTKMCKDHPYQTLYSLYALRSAGMAQSQSMSSNSSRNKQSGTQPGSSSQQMRAAAADAMWNELMANQVRQAEMRDFKTACDAYTEWAKFNLKAHGARFFDKGGAIKKSCSLPAGLSISAIRDLKAPVATADIPIDKTCKYLVYVSLARYSRAFSTAGGVHLPKIIECVGSDGNRYKQLVRAAYLRPIYINELN